MPQFELMSWDTQPKSLCSNFIGIFACLDFAALFSHILEQDQLNLYQYKKVCFSCLVGSLKQISHPDVIGLVKAVMSSILTFQFSNKLGQNASN